MNESEDQRLRRLLQAALPPMGRRDSEEDLWPRMLVRLERTHATPWADLAWAALGAGLLVAFPQVIPWILLQC